MSHDKSKNTARKGYNTTLRIDLMKRLRVLAAHLDKKQNDLIEDAIIDYLNKHEKKVIG
jgi:predicted transcriptional regulator